MSQLPRTCSDLHDILGAYSIGATTPAENRVIEALLPNCPEAAAELDGYLAVRESLMQLAAEERTIPPGRDLLASLPLDDDLRAYPEVTASRAPRHEDTAERLRPSTENDASDDRQRAFPAAVWYAFGSVAAALVIVVGMLAMTNKMLAEMRAERETLLALVEEAAARPAAPTTVNATGFRPEGVTHVHLTPAVDEAPNGAADVVWDAATGLGTLTVRGLPPLPEGTRYQMWLVRDGEEHSVGLFTVNEDGTGALVFRAVEPLTAFSVIGISMEPDAGSDVPTTPHMITGQIEA